MDYEIRALSFGEILDTAFRLVRNHPKTLIGISLLLYLPYAVVAGFFTDEQMLAQLSSSAVMVMVLSALALMVISPIVSAAITHAVGEIYLGRPAGIRESLGVGWSVLLPLIGTTILLSLIVMGGFLLLVIPGIILMLAYSVVNPVMILERYFGLAALRRSQTLTKGHRMRALGLMMVAGIIMVVLTSGFEIMMAFIPFVGSVGSGIAQSIGMAFYSAVYVVFYFDLRCRQEAFDLEHLAQLVENQGSPSAESISQ